MFKLLFLISLVIICIAVFCYLVPYIVTTKYKGDLRFRIYSDKRDFGYLDERTARNIAKSLRQENYKCQVCDMLPNGKVHIIECNNLIDTFNK